MGMLLNATFLAQRGFHRRFHKLGVSSRIVCFPAFQRRILELSSHGFGVRECEGVVEEDESSVRREFINTGQVKCDKSRHRIHYLPIKAGPFHLLPHKHRLRYFGVLE